MKILLIVALFFVGAFAKTYKVGFAQDTLANDWRKAQVDEAVLAASEYSFIDLTVKDADGKVANQILHIDQFIDKGYDFIITSPADAFMTGFVTQKAIDSGIPVILSSRGVEGEGYTTFIAPDNAKIARQAAEFMVQKMNGKGVVLMLQGLEGATTVVQRREGFEEVLANYPDMSIIYKTGNFLRNDTMKVMEELYRDGVHFDAIYSHSDSMLVGVREVMSAVDDTREIVTVGIDYIQSAKRAIQDGRQTASFTYPTASKESVQAVVDMIEGKTVPRHITIDSVMVTIENASEVDPIF